MFISELSSEELGLTISVTVNDNNCCTAVFQLKGESVTRTTVTQYPTDWDAETIKDDLITGVDLLTIFDDDGLSKWVRAGVAEVIN